MKKSKTKGQIEREKVDSLLKREDSSEKINSRLKNKIKKAVITIITALTLKLGFTAALLTVLITIVLIIAMFVTLLITSILGFFALFDFDSDSNGAFTEQQKGSQYIWNNNDLNKLSSEYLKNMYRQAWLIDNAKQLTHSDASIPLMMAIPVYESGGYFFSDSEEHSVADYACGMTSIKDGAADPDVYQGIYAWFITCNGTSFGTKFSNYLTKYKTTQEELWGSMTHSSDLDTSLLSSDRLRYVSTYSTDNDVMYSNYNIAASVFMTVSSYEETTNFMFNKDSDDKDSGHFYKKYLDKAIASYNQSENSEKIRKYADDALFYTVHAGGVWGYFNQKDYDIYMSAICDYIVYCYVNYNKVYISDDFISQAKTTAFGHTPTRCATMGDANANYTALATYVYPPTVENSCLYQKGKQLDKSLMQSWQEYCNSASKSNYVKAYQIAAVYEGSGYNPLKQHTYAVANGPAMNALGMLRLNAIADDLGYTWVYDETSGFIFNGASGGGEPVKDGHAKISKTFEESKKTIMNREMSNYRNDDWFATLNTSEWCLPLTTDKSAASGGCSISSRYGWRYYNGWVWHGGMDITYKTQYYTQEERIANYPVYAMHDGTITQLERVCGKVSGAGRTFAYEVTYTRGDETVTRYITYFHLSSINEDLKVGDSILKGQQIGSMGGSGDYEMQYGKHLHVQIGLNPNARGLLGLFDTETELPFLTFLDNYTAWNSTGNGYSGYLIRKPETQITSETADPQSAGG